MLQADAHTTIRLYMLRCEELERQCLQEVSERESENRYQEVPPSSTVLDEQSVLAG